jgi:Transposase DDE domain
MEYDMLQKEVGVGGFYLPKVYKKNQKRIEIRLEQGDIDYADLTHWSFPDEFLCFVMESQLLKFVDKTYPNPRTKNQIPIWFLISCQFVMHLYQTGRYNHLRYLLNAGSILTRFGFNVGSPKIGFNDKNKKERETAIDADSVRKFFKDTKPDDIRDWYREDLQSWFRVQKAFDHQGIFILDQSHLVVPDNENYVNAVKMPVDEHGQRYPNQDSLTNEQKRALIYHRCYALSTLLNVGVQQELFHIASYELGPGNEDELTQAEKLLFTFCRKFPGAIRLLIIDRGYINSSFIHKLKNDYKVDTLIPLRKNMDVCIDSIALAKEKNTWETIESKTNTEGQLILKKEIITVSKIELWEPLKLQALVTRYTQWDEKNSGYEEHYAVLVSTKEYSDPKKMVTYYDLRVKTEERFRQLKRSWYISDFTSPHASLIESHVCFTLLTYSLLQLYLRREELQQQTHQMMETLRKDERLGKNAVLVYAGHHYGVFDLDDYTLRVAGLTETPRQRLITIMQTQKEARLKREK